MRDGDPAGARAFMAFVRRLWRLAPHAGRLAGRPQRVDEARAGAARTLLNARLDRLARALRAPAGD